MRKFLALLAVALVVAAAVWVVLRIQLANRLAAVPELLPGTTLLLVEAPDLARTRGLWHESDLYQIWHEPAVQAWLQKPLARLPQDGRGGRRALDEFLQLGPKHAFLALTSLEKSEPKLVGGFHFEVEPEKAREFITQHQAKWWPKGKAAKHETTVYEQHQIEAIAVGHLLFASVYDNHWYLASNDLEALKALLDRADRRGEKAKSSLRENEAFAAATGHLHGDYAGMLYVDPQPFVQKLGALLAMTEQPFAMAQLERLKSVRSLTTAIGFQHGKMRETDFVAMPRLGPEKKLGHPLLAAADVNTFLYSLSELRWPADMLAPTTAPVSGLSAALRQVATALTARGVSANDLQSAFGEEMEVTGNWAEGAHLPTFLATMPVIDSAKARKIVGALAAVEIAGAAWTKTEKEGATLYSIQLLGGLFPLSATMAVSDRLFLFGSDPNAVETALTKVAHADGGLEKSATFRDAAALVPTAESIFNYVDTRLLFERADTALRPLLTMGATLYPAWSKNVDLARLPPAAAIAKHLSPIVMSQRYESDGYVTESVGPITFREGTVGVAAGVLGAFAYFREGLGQHDLLPASPLISPTPSPTPSPF